MSGWIEHVKNYQSLGVEDPRVNYNYATSPSGSFERLRLESLTKQDTKTLSNPMVAFGAKEFLRVYSARLAVDVSDVRSALTNKLLELANCGDPRFELKALELLGKHSDIALFTERSEVTVNYKTSEDLESAIKERIKRLLKSNVVDVDAKSYAPNTSQALEMELGPVKDRTQNDSSAED